MSVDPSAAPPDDPQEGPPLPQQGLVLVSTPIGNLGDISSRARAVLANCDLILCEDIRRTTRLLTAMGIHARTESLHEHNEDTKIPLVLERIRGKQKIALVSDAGTPLVSDPGYRLVRALIAADLPVTAVPGANAALMALTLSGLPPMPFLFLGFPNARQSARRSLFSGLRAAERAGLSATLIFYEAPHRLLETLADLLAIFGDRPGAVARELTKRFETVKRGRMNELIEVFTIEPPRGEVTVIIGPPENDDMEALDERLRSALKTQSVKDAAALVAFATGLPRKIVYAHALRLVEEGLAIK